MRRFALPIASGVLFALAFYPFSLWPCALVALAPLYYFATDARRAARDIFWGGCLAGAIVSVPLYYFTLAQLGSEVGLENFILAVRFLSVPAALLESSLFGLLALSWRFAHTNFGLCNCLFGASAYLLLERGLALLFGGYNPDALSYAAIGLPGAFTLAALGGVALVSFAAAACNIFLAELIHIYRSRALRQGLVLLCSAAACLAAVGWYGAHLAHAPVAGAAVSVASIQTAPTRLDELMFGTQDGNTFSDPRLQAYLAEAARGSSLVIYPFSPQEQITSTAQQAATGRWLQTVVPSSTSVLLWISAQEEDRLYDEYALWQDGVESTYQKHALYAFSDYTPAFARGLGVEKSPYTISPGSSTRPLVVDGVALAGLICSELHQNSYARTQAASSDALIAAGYDAFFPGALMGNYSLAVARYRAAENNLPVVRANIYGPSAIINADGSVQTMLPFGARGIMRGFIRTGARQPTLYMRFSSWPVYIAMFCALACGALRMLRRRN